MTIRLFEHIAHTSAHRAFKKFATAPTKSSIVRAALPSIAASHAMVDAFKQLRSQTQKPEPQTTVVWRHPKARELTTAVSALRERTKGTAGAILYHGTPHTDNMIEQAESCSEGLGKLEKRVCSNGDAAAGIYGTSCPVATYEYSGSPLIAKIISTAKVHFDEARGTPFIEAGDDKHLVEVLCVTNHDAIKDHKHPTLADSILVAAAAGSKVFTELKEHLALDKSPS